MVLGAGLVDSCLLARSLTCLSSIGLAGGALAVGTERADAGLAVVAGAGLGLLVGTVADAVLGGAVRAGSGARVVAGLLGGTVAGRAGAGLAAAAGLVAPIVNRFAGGFASPFVSGFFSAGFADEGALAGFGLLAGDAVVVGLGEGFTVSGVLGLGVAEEGFAADRGVRLTPATGFFVAADTAVLGVTVPVCLVEDFVGEDGLFVAVPSFLEAEAGVLGFAVGFLSTAAAPAATATAPTAAAEIAAAAIALSSSWGSMSTTGANFSIACTSSLGGGLDANVSGSGISTAGVGGGVPLSIFKESNCWAAASLKSAGEASINSFFTCSTTSSVTSSILLSTACGMLHARRSTVPFVSEFCCKMSPCD